jgi:hypothetical protein
MTTNYGNSVAITAITGDSGVPSTAAFAGLGWDSGDLLRYISLRELLRSLITIPPFSVVAWI